MGAFVLVCGNVFDGMADHVNGPAESWSTRPTSPRLARRWADHGALADTMDIREMNPAEFDRGVRHGDGAVGVQMSQPAGETFGGMGQLLVKEVVMFLPALRMSVKPGGSARKIDRRGGLKTHGSGIPPIEQHSAIETLGISGGSVAASGGFDSI